MSLDGARAVVAIARADFLERVRRYGFLVTIGFTLLAAYLFLPPNHSRYATLQLDGHRGVYNSAWVGNLVALLTAAFLGLAGFYLVKNAVDHDRRTGVGVILAGTPITRWRYALGKWLSHLAVLGAVVAVMAVGAAAMQLVRGEDRSLDLARLLAPFLLLTLPVMALVAALALCFEATPWLRGGLGNVAYFWLWALGLLQGAVGPGGARLDPLGFEQVVPSMAAACQRAFPGYDLVHRPMSLGFNIRESGSWDLGIFVWEGPHWTAAAALGRAAWVGAALALTALAALVFDRFDEQAVWARRTPRKSRRASSRDAPGGLTPLDEPEAAGALAGPEPPAGIHLTPLSASRRFGLAPLVATELRLLLRGARPAWWLVTGGFFLASALAPLPAARWGVLAALWIWPLLLWSPLGSRESRHGTGALVFSAPRPIARLLTAQWAAGALLGLGLSAAIVVRLGAAGELAGLFGVVAGSLFIPALAVALGAWSGSSKLFEVVYLLLWYLGPVNRLPALDFATPPGGGAVAGWIAATASCLVAAVAARATRANR